MKADFTRKTFDPLKHYSRVLMQQGRVQLDADWNEQSSILIRQLRRFIADLLPNGGGTGFGLAKIAAKVPAPHDFAIGAGTYYTGGIMCELEATPVAVFMSTTSPPANTIKVATWTVDGLPYRADQYVRLSDDAQFAESTPVTAKITDVDYGAMTLTLDGSDLSGLAKAKMLRARRIVTYQSQPDFPRPVSFKDGARYQVYLDVWERLITYLDDDSIREVALNGPDTAVRAKVVWQVKTTPYIEPPFRITGGSSGPAVTEGSGSDAMTCMTVQSLQDLPENASTGLMRARTEPAQISTDPCTISPDSAYRNAENQLYRVEIHTGSADAPDGPTFKWSRENGSVAYAIVGPVASGGGVTTVTLEDLGRDDRFGLAVGDYVEIEDDASVLANVTQPLLQVQSLDRDALLVTLTGTADKAVGSDAALHPKLRRWDHKAGNPATNGLDIAKDGAAKIVAGQWLNLEDGVQVQFPQTDQVWYRTADYWLIAARVATGDIIWPTETGFDAHGNATVYQIAKPPDGVKHYYAPLGVVTINDRGTAAPAVSLCRQSIAAVSHAVAFIPPPMSPQ